MKVPFAPLALHTKRHRAGIDAAIARVLDSGHYIGGPEVEKFEAAFAQFCGAKHCVAVANGTDAIALALRAAGIKEGDEVITSAVSAYPTAVGIKQCGAIPIFADIDLETGLIDLSRIDDLRPIVPVHLYGSVCPIDRREGIIVEDCAQAHGAIPAGRAGIASAWSFYPTKNLGALGDGGAITTDSTEIAERLRRLRNYGQRNRYEHVEQGWNSRLDPLQAAVLAVKLRALPEENERRRKLAAIYDAGLAGRSEVIPLRVPAGCTPSRHLYPVRLRDPARREWLMRELSARGIETLIHYPIAMPDQQATAAASRRGDFPNARALCASVLSLPLHPEHTEEQIEHVVASLTVLLSGG